MSTPRPCTMTSAALLAAACCVPAPAAVILVPADHATIQAAIVAASGGDEIVVATGVYNEQIDFLGKAITVRSAGDVDLTVIDGTGLTGSLVTFDSGEGPASVLRELTVANGDAFCGAGVRVTGASPTIDGCVFIGHTGAQGSALCVEGAGADATVTGGTFTGNVADLGGAVIVKDGAAATFDTCGFDHNDSLPANRGGGAILNRATVTIIDCTFDQNRALGDTNFRGGGAVFADSGGTTTITGSTFSGNAAGSTTFGRGGAIRAAGGATVGVSDCTFTANVAITSGGALYVGQASDVTLDGCTLDDNATLNPSGAGRGGAAHVQNATLRFRRCSLTANAADTGGALSAAPSGDLVVSSCLLTANAAGAGGGAYLLGTTATMTNCLLLRNTAAGRGGAIAARSGGAVQIGSCTVLENEALLGGGLWCDGTNAAVSNTIVRGNRGRFGADEVLLEAGGNPMYTGCNLQGAGGSGAGWNPAYGADGGGNIDAPPRFADPDGTDDAPGSADDDYRLFATSPGIDAGTEFALLPDLADLDGDLDTLEPIPLDLGEQDRRLDDPATPDTGLGAPPLPDIGAHEHVAGMPGAGDGPHVWTDPAGGNLLDPANWSPDAPTPVSAAVFGPPANYTVTVPVSVTTDRLVVADGDVTISLAGSTWTLGQPLDDGLLVGPFTDTTARLRVAGGALALIDARVAGAGAGVLEVGAGASVNVGNALRVEPGAALTGDGAVNGTVENFGRLEPGTGGVGTLALGGTLVQSGTRDDGTPVAGTIHAELGAGGTFDVVTVSGGAELGGSLEIETLGGFSTSPGQTYAVLTADTITGDFDVVVARRLTADYYFAVSTAAPFAGQESVVVEVTAQPDPFAGYDPPVQTVLSGVPVDAVLADFDAALGLDLAVVLDGTPGTVEILLNDGTGSFASAQTITVGNGPTAIAVGDFDAEQGPDLVVTNGDDDTLSIMLNDGAGTLAAPQTEPLPAIFPTDPVTGQGAVSVHTPVSVATGDLLGGPAIDIAVGCATSQTLFILENLGATAFVGNVILLSTGQTIELEDGPGVIDPEDLDGDKDLDIILIVGPILQVYRKDPGGFTTSSQVEAGADPADFVLEDLDGDALPDVVVANAGDDTVSIVSNRGDLLFRASGTVEVGGTPGSITTLDYDDDGDQDVALIVDDAGTRIVQVLRNDTNGGTRPVFTTPEDVESGDDPVVVLGGDVDGDGDDELVTVNESSTAATGPRGAGRAASRAPGPVGAVVTRDEIGPACPADLNDDGSVGFSDLNDVLGAWGPCPGCPADLNGDDSVGFADLNEVLGAWGPCP